MIESQIGASFGFYLLLRLLIFGLYSPGLATGALIARLVATSIFFVKFKIFILTAAFLLVVVGRPPGGGAALHLHIDTRTHDFTTLNLLIL